MDELTKAVKYAYPYGINGWKILDKGYTPNEGFGVTHGVWLERYGRTKFVTAVSLLAGSPRTTGAEFRQALEDATNPIYDLSDMD